MRLTRLLTHTYRITLGLLFAGAGSAIMAIRQTWTASTVGLLLDVGLGISVGPVVTALRCCLADPEVSNFDPEDDSIGDGTMIFSGVPPSMGEWSGPCPLTI